MAQPSPLPQLFGIIPTGSPCLTTPTSSPSPTSFLFTLPSNHPFSHICVFLLPGIVLPPDTAAAVYISIPNTQAQPQFKFLGGIGPGKESAIFKVSGLGGLGGGGGGQNGEVDMDAPEDSNPTTTTTSEPITLGISLESSSSVSAQMAALQSSQTQPTNPANPSSTLVVAPRPGTEIKKQPDTLLLAQRIIKNAFNFLASFSGNIDGGVEVVPLKAFEEWWRKFEGRVRNDPGFLERDGD